MKNQIDQIHANFLNCSKAWKAVLNFKLEFVATLEGQSKEWHIEEVPINKEESYMKMVQDLPMPLKFAFWKFSSELFHHSSSNIQSLEEFLITSGRNCFGSPIASLFLHYKEEIFLNSVQTRNQLMFEHLERHTSLTTKMFEEEYTDAKLIINKRIIELHLNQLDKDIENHHQLMKDRLEKLTNWVYYLHEGGQLENSEDIDNAMDSFLQKLKEFVDSPITVMPLFCIVDDAMHNFINMKFRCVQEKLEAHVNLFFFFNTELPILFICVNKTVETCGH